MCSLLVLLSILVLCHGLIIHDHVDNEDILTKSIVELTPIYITCQLSDIVVISAPVVNCKQVVYYLHKPSGDALKLDFTHPKQNSNSQHSTYHYEKYKFWDHNEIIVKYINENIKAVYPKSNAKVVNTNFGEAQSVTDFIVEDTENRMKEKDFMMGPLFEEDHGNWVLSIYCRDVDGRWIELFQVITIQIIVSVPMEHPKVRLEEGSTFNLNFAYPIDWLETCELTAPKSTFDRYFDRNRIVPNRCGYVVTNVTKQDEGIWTVIGVGRMVYEGRTELKFGDNNKVT